MDAWGFGCMDTSRRGLTRSSRFLLEFDPFRLQNEPKFCVVALDGWSAPPFGAVRALAFNVCPLGSSQEIPLLDGSVHGRVDRDVDSRFDCSHEQVTVVTPRGRNPRNSRVVGVRIDFIVPWGNSIPPRCHLAQSGSKTGAKWTIVVHGP